MAKKSSSTPAKNTRVASQGSGAAALTTGFADMPLAEKITWISLHLLIFLVPLAVANLTGLGIGGGLPLTFDQFDIMKLFVMRAFTVVAFAAWGISLLLRGGKVRFTKVDWLILALLAWVGITTATSIHWPTALFGKYRRFEGLLSFINYAVVYFLVVQMVDRPSRIRSLARTLFFSGFFVMLYGALQYVGVEPISYGSLPFEPNRSFATYGNPDLLGGFLMFMLPISIMLALSEDGVAWRTFYWIGSVLTAVVTLTAFTRSAWVGAAAVLPILVIVVVRQKVKPRTEDWVMAGTATLLAAIVVVKSLGSANEVMNVWTRVRSIFEFDQGSALTRFQIWSAAWEAIKERPIFGFGADTFRLVFPVFKPAAYVAAAGYLSVADNVHNYPLQIGSALGIPGFLLLYGLFGWILVSTARETFSKTPSASRLMYAGIWAAAVGYIVHLFFGLSVTGTTVLLWLCFGLLMAPTARTVEVKAPTFAVGAAGALVVGVVAIVLFAGNVQYVMADHQYLLARVGGLGAAARAAAAERAVELNPYNDIYRAEVGLAYVDWGYARINGQSGEPNVTAASGLEMLQRAEASFKETIAFAPPEYDNYVFLSNLYNTMASMFDKGYYDDALEIARKGIAVERYGPAIRLEYARALDGTGETDEAIQQLEYALKLDPMYTGGTLLLAELYQREGDPQRALELLESFNELKPSEPGVSDAIRRAEASITAR